MNPDVEGDIYPSYVYNCNITTLSLCVATWSMSAYIIIILMSAYSAV